MSEEKKNEIHVYGRSFDTAGNTTRWQDVTEAFKEAMEPLQTNEVSDRLKDALTSGEDQPDDEPNPQTQ